MPNTSTDLFNMNLWFWAKGTNTQILVEALKLWCFQEQRFVSWTFNSSFNKLVTCRWWWRGKVVSESSTPSLGDFPHKPWNKVLHQRELERKRIMQYCHLTGMDFFEMCSPICWTNAEKCRATCFLELVSNQLFRRLFEYRFSAV